MPNWCECELRVSGPKRDVDTFVRSVLGPREDETPFDFNKIIPYPEEFAEPDRRASEWGKMYADVPYGQRPPRPADGFNNGGYEWCRANWGTKWPASSVSFEKTSRGCTYRFETAWSPPEPVVRKAALAFPTLTLDLKYWEGGSGYRGQLTAKGEEIISEWCEDGYRGNRGG